MQSGAKGNRRVIPNYFPEVLDELAVEYGIDRDKLQEFSQAFFYQFSYKLRRKRDFSIPTWGVFTFSKTEDSLVPGGRKIKLIKARLRANATRYKKKRAKTALKRAEKKKMKIVNKLFLRKVANELEYVLSLYH
jgi:hypothetical protein